MSEVLKALSERGFAVVEPQCLSLSDQSRVFSEAEVIVMPLGSAMANTVYCRLGAKIIEILSPCAVQACTWVVCSERKAEYYFIFAIGTNQDASVLHEDILADLKKLMETLDFAGVC